MKCLLNCSRGHPLTCSLAHLLRKTNKLKSRDSTRNTHCLRCLSPLKCNNLRCYINGFSQNTVRYSRIVSMNCWIADSVFVIVLSLFQPSLVRNSINQEGRGIGIETGQTHGRTDRRTDGRSDGLFVRPFVPEILGLNTCLTYALP